MSLQSTICLPGTRQDHDDTTPKTPGASLKFKSNVLNEAKTTVTPSQPSTTGLYRLLYRGALSLPDSHLLLDGLTFSARLDSPSKHTKSYSLLDNPLALALESMRGRPSLRFMGVVKLADVYLDETGNVEMDIHPRAILSRIYFENTFCLKPFSSSSPSKIKPLSSDFGVKVALGDSDGPETTETVIYAQMKNGLTASEDDSPPPLRLTVGRITVRPQPVKRLPRPDDPIPRKPPALFAREISRTESRGSMALAIGANKIGKVNDLKRANSGSFASSSSGLPNGAKRAKLVGGTASMNDVFKVPEVPSAKQKGKEKETMQDVFGDVAEVHQVKGKLKAPSSANGQAMVDPAAMEKANKAVIKKATIAHLAQTKDPTNLNVLVDKKHPEFKDLYNTIYRGICFALRNRMKTEAVDTSVVDRLLKMHVKMYLTGHGVGDPPSSGALNFALMLGKTAIQLGKAPTKPVNGAGTTDDPIRIGR